MILSGSAQEVGHWVSSSIVSASLRRSEASNLRSTIITKPNSTIQSHELLWLLGLTTPGLQDAPGATEVLYIGAVTRMDNLMLNSVKFTWINVVKSSLIVF